VFKLLQTAFTDEVFRLRFKVLVAAMMKIQVYWNVMLHQLVSSHWHFQGTVLPTTTQQSTWCNISQDLNHRVFIGCKCHAIKTYSKEDGAPSPLDVCIRQCAHLSACYFTPDKRTLSNNMRDCGWIPVLVWKQQKYEKSLLHTGIKLLIQLTASYSMTVLTQSHPMIIYFVSTRCPKIITNAK
jgi:hypothetical protein